MEMSKHFLALSQKDRGEKRRSWLLNQAELNSNPNTTTYQLQNYEQVIYTLCSLVLLIYNLQGN